MLLTPLVLFYTSRHWISAWLFFTTSNYFYYFIEGAYPQALVQIIVLAILIEKDWKFDILLLLIAGTAHSYGFRLALVFLGAKYANKLGLKQKIEWVWQRVKRIPKKGIFPACSGVFGANTPAVLNAPVQGLSNTGYSLIVKDLLFLPTKLFPFPYIYWGLKKAWNKNRLDLIIITVFATIGSILISTRMFYIVPLALIPALCWFYEDLSRNRKILFIAFTVVTGMANLYFFLNLKTCSGFGVLPI